MNGNDISAGGNVFDSIFVTGSGNTINFFKVYNKDEFRDVVKNTFNSDELISLMQEFFPSVESQLKLHEGGLQSTLSYEAAIDFFAQYQKLPDLMAAIKKRSPQLYRHFLADQILQAIGLTSERIPDVSLDTGAVKQELQKIQSGPVRKIPKGSDIEFENHDNLFDLIRYGEPSYSPSHFYIYGPAGVGKTHFLKQCQAYFDEKYGDTCCIYIDLGQCPLSSILLEILKQFPGDENLDSGLDYSDLVMAIIRHIEAHPRLNRFYFLFDRGDENPDAVEWLFSPENLIDNVDFRRPLTDLNYSKRIELKIVVAARHPIERKTVHPKYSIEPIIHPLLERRSINRMLDRLAHKRNIPVSPVIASEISDRIYFLTGGHPKCAIQILTVLARKLYARPTEVEWEALFKNQVMPTIKAEMLSTLDIEMLNTLWALSNFRHIDQHLLGSLIERDILFNKNKSDSLFNSSRQARELRKSLDQTYFFDQEVSTDTMAMNASIRRALSLSMKYDSIDRYKFVNSTALEIFLDRLQSANPIIEKGNERKVMHLMEIIFHWVQILAVEAQEVTSPEPVCSKLVEAVGRYIALALSLLKEDEQAGFIGVLIDKWEHDHELHEAICNLSDGEACLRQLTEKIRSLRIVNP